MDRKVMFATPSYDRNFCAEYVMSMMQTVVDLQAVGIENTLVVIGGDCFVDRARNMACHAFLASDATDLFFIDADMGWDVAGIHRLLAHEPLIVGGAYRRREDSEGYAVRFGGSMLMDAAGLVEAEGLPAGFLRIRRAALEQMAEHVPTYEQEGKVVRRFFSTGIRDGEFWGEDLNFCRDWIALGQKLYLDPDISFMHVGRKKWTGNYLEFVKRLQPRAAA